MLKFYQVGEHGAVNIFFGEHVINYDAPKLNCITWNHWHYCCFDAFNGYSSKQKREEEQKMTKHHEEHQMKLFPFKIEALQTVANEIPYGVKMHQAPDVWEAANGGEGIVVCILDTGIDKGHPDLRDNIIGGRNFTNEGGTDNWEDGNGHGTHVAGTIAAVENGNGVVGMAPKAKLLIGRVLGTDGSGAYDWITKGIKWATDWKGPNGEKVRVISMSLGGGYNDPRMQKAILEACAKGILVVCAAGNEGDSDETTFEFGYPALINETISVAACDENRQLASFSNNNLQVDVIGAGVKVLSTYPKSQYAVLSGTSMATPHISGALALLIAIGEKQFKRTLTESELFALLTKCCCSLGYQKSSEGSGMPELTKINQEC
jgi:major intracellular serine protease